MRGRVKMECIHHVFKRNRIFSRVLDFTVKVRCAKHNQSVRLVSVNHRNNDMRIFLDILPSAVAIGLIANFKNHVWHIRIFPSHFVKERNRLGKIHIRILIF